MRGVGRAEDVGGAEPLARLVGVEQRVVAPAPKPQERRSSTLVPRALELHRRCGRATACRPCAKWQSMPSSAATRADLVDRVGTSRAAARPRPRGATPRRPWPATSGTAPSTSRRCARSRRSRPISRLEHDDRAAPGRPWRGSRRSRARCSRRRRSRRRPRSIPASAGRASPASSSGRVSHQNDSRRRSCVLIGPSSSRYVRGSGTAAPRLVGLGRRRTTRRSGRRRPHRAVEVLLGVLGRAGADLDAEPRRAAARARASRRAPCGTADGCRPTAPAAGGRRSPGARASLLLALEHRAALPSTMALR